MNSENEENSDPCQPNLPNMPKVVMEEVLKHLDFRFIFRLRIVCRDLRSTIDEINPELHLNRIWFNLPLNTSSMESYLDIRHEYAKEFIMKSNPPRTGCTIGWEQESKYKLAKIPMKDVEVLLKNRKVILDDLHIDLLFSIGNVLDYNRKIDEDLKKFYDSTMSLLTIGGQLLRTKEIHLEVHNLSEAPGLLKCIDPKKLECISIQARDWNARRAVEMDFSELEKLEQWYKAEKLGIRGNYILTPVESFASFNRINVWVDELPIEKLNEVKELFIRSPTLKTFIIKSNEISKMKDLLISNFGQFDSHDEVYEDDVRVCWHRRRGRRLKTRTWKWFKNASDSTEKLQITLNIGIFTCINFSKI